MDIRVQVRCRNRPGTSYLFVSFPARRLRLAGESWSEPESESARAAAAAGSGPPRRAADRGPSRSAAGAPAVKIATVTGGRGKPKVTGIAGSSARDWSRPGGGAPDRTTVTGRRLPGAGGTQAGMTEPGPGTRTRRT